MTAMRRSLVGLMVAALAAGSVAVAPAAPAQEDPERARLVEELEWTQEVFHNATPGWPAQFRARESADHLRASLGG